MANVKFFKGTCTDTTTYEAGGIYFDLKTREIRLGKDGTTAYDAYGNGIKDATLANNKLTISFNNGKSDIVLDFSDIASAKVTMEVFSKLDERLKALETAAPKAGNDISITEGTNAINVALKEDITVAGGPLADDIQDNWPSDPEWTVGGVKTIPAGLSLTDILTKLFTKVINGTVAFSYTTWNPVLGAPAVSLSSSATQEVGGEITASWTANDSVSENTVTATCKASQGYFTSTDGSWNSGNYSQSINGTQTGEPTVASTWNGVAVATSGSNVTCKEGANVLNCVNSGVTATMGNFAAATIYASTNTKKCLPSINAVLDTDVRAGNKALTSVASETIYAYYPIYAYGDKSSTTDTSAPTVAAPAKPAKLPLVADGSKFGVAFPAMVDGGAGYRILLEAGKSIKSATALNGLTSKYDINCLDKFKKGETVTMATGATTTAYNVWEYKGTEGANRVIFTIGK